MGVKNSPSGDRGGGYRVKFFNLYHFEICFSPEYIVSRMDSLSPQLGTVLKIYDTMK